MNKNLQMADYYGIKKEYDDFALPMPVPGDNRPENVR